MNDCGSMIDGFFVSENRKKLWSVELMILDYLENACKKLNINYFMLMGSAIGAARHKGFIPWDDDIDLGMLREDFDVFCEKGKQFFPEFLDIQYGVSDRGADCLLRIRDKRTTGIIRGEELFDGNKGIFIEIYCYDYCSDNLLRKVQLKMAKILQSLMFSRKYKNPHTSQKKKILKECFRWIPLSLVWRLYNWVVKLQSKNSPYVDILTLPDYSKKKKEMALVEDLKKIVYMPFEDRQVRMPVGYDRLLSRVYGDYMKLPPIEKRGAHHDNTVFYDPNKPYTAYEGNDVIERYFRGETGLELI